jgi:2-oxoglutarate dehydrogenase E1 component
MEHTVYVDEFRFSKMEISFTKSICSTSGSYTRAKRRHADAKKMVFDKNLFR